MQAAWVVLIKPKIWERHGLKLWIEAARKRLHHNVLAIALADQLARIRLERPSPWPGVGGAVYQSGSEPIHLNCYSTPTATEAENREVRDDVARLIRFTCRGLREDRKRWRMGLPRRMRTLVARNGPLSLSANETHAR